MFLDPPYRKGLIPKALASLKAGGWLAANALLVAETASDEIIDACTRAAAHDASSNVITIGKDDLE